MTEVILSTMQEGQLHRGLSQWHRDHSLLETPKGVSSPVGFYEPEIATALPELAPTTQGLRGCSRGLSFSPEAMGLPGSE